jgi:hypothetical protein
MDIPSAHTRGHKRTLTLIAMNGTHSLLFNALQFEQPTVQNAQAFCTDKKTAFVSL